MYFLNCTVVFPGQPYISPLFIMFCYPIEEEFKVQENISTHLSKNQFVMQQVRSVYNWSEDLK